MSGENFGDFLCASAVGRSRAVCTQITLDALYCQRDIVAQKIAAFAENRRVKHEDRTSYRRQALQSRAFRTATLSLLGEWVGRLGCVWVREGVGEVVVTAGVEIAGTIGGGPAQALQYNSLCDLFVRPLCVALPCSVYASVCFLSAVKRALFLVLFFRLTKLPAHPTPLPSQIFDK